MTSHTEVREGMEAYGSDGQRVGVVTRVEEDYFVQVIHIDGTDGHYTVPSTAVDHVEEDRVLLPNPSELYFSQLHAHDPEYEEARVDFEQHFAGRQGQPESSGTARTFEQAERNYRAGYQAGREERYQDRTFEEVEPELRGHYEERHGGAGGIKESWEHLREEIREGWNRVRRH